MTRRKRPQHRLEHWRGTLSLTHLGAIVDPDIIINHHNQHPNPTTKHVLAGTSGKKVQWAISKASAEHQTILNLRRDHPCHPVDQSKRLDAIACRGTAAMPGESVCNARGGRPTGTHACMFLLRTDHSRVSYQHSTMIQSPHGGMAITLRRHDHHRHCDIDPIAAHGAHSTSLRNILS